MSERDASEVVRYWLASLQLEEALSSRPRARRPPDGSSVPRLDAPVPGHDYFKLPLDAALHGLLCDKAALHRPFDPELAAFFETWLSAQYRRGEEDKELAHLLSFPVVHLPRGELAGVLRCGVRLRFGEPGGAAFAVPSRAQRRRREYPGAPGEARLRATEAGARQWPFFVDTRLLNQQLGVARESIDALFDALRAQAEVTEAGMLALVCEMLEHEAERALSSGETSTSDARAQPTRAGGAAAGGSVDPAQPASSIARVTAAVGRLLARRGGRARVYPVAIVLDASRAKATWYLQREMQWLLQDAGESAWNREGCLGTYLRGASSAGGMAVQRALFPGPAPSPSQRQAAEACLGSRFTAVQGPPGTGKTTLILHLAAEALVRQVDALVKGGTMGDGLFVVTSTNNRAVDNVVDPLLELSPAALPLALRTGNRLVCEQVLGPQLARARQWLTAAQQQPAAERSAALGAALQEFRQQRDLLAAQLSPREQAFALETRRDRLHSELLQLRETELDTGDAAGLAELDGSALDRLRTAARKLQKRLLRLCELCTARPSVTALQEIDRHQRRTQGKEQSALQTAATAAGFALQLGLPPDLPPSTDPAVLIASWEDAAQAALIAVEGVEDRIEAALDRGRRRRVATQLQRELDALPDPQLLAEIAAPDCTPLQRALFAAAIAVREAWAANHAGELLDAVDCALAAARDEGTLRPLFNDRGRRFALFRQLFGLWGCTLLSLGNCLPAQADVIAQLVIDEAGQCHPAFALSGLLRCRSALVIGDVHQLEPVIDLEPDEDERVVQTCKPLLASAALEPYRVHAQAQSSVQRLADSAVPQRPRLLEHFRCQPEIIAICDELCGYGLQVLTPRQAPSAALAFLPDAVSLVDVAGSQERHGGSWHNTAELEASLELVQALLHAGLAPEELAVITPYRGQLEQLRQGCARLGVAVDTSVELHELDDGPSARGRGVGLGTVHRFQGGERSVVIFSSVVTQRGSLAFLDRHPNLLNVAISRARHRLIAVGDRGLLATGRRTGLLVRAAHVIERESFRMQLGLGLV